MSVLSPASRRLATVSAVTSLAMTTVLLAVARANGTGAFEPPDEAAGRVAFITALALPGVLCLIGAWRGRPMVLVGSGILSTFGSVASFSGVTLLYLVPAIGMFVAAADRPPTGRPVRRTRLLAMVLTAIPLGLVIVLATGFLGVVGLALLGGFAIIRDRAGRLPPVTPSEGVIGIATAALVIGAWFALLGLTEPACWSGRSSATGAIEWVRIPMTDTLLVDAGEVGETCTTSHPTALAVALAVAASVGAVTVASWERR